MPIVSTTLHIEGMTCGHCQKSVQHTLAELPGVTACEVSLEKGEAKVEYNVEHCSKEKMLAAINEDGIYTAS